MLNDLFLLKTVGENENERLCDVRYVSYVKKSVKEEVKEANDTTARWLSLPIDFSPVASPRDFIQVEHLGQHLQVSADLGFSPTGPVPNFYSDNPPSPRHRKAIWSK